MKKRVASQIQRCLSKTVRDTDVLAVILFGSRAKKHASHDFSDIDLCLVLCPARYSPASFLKKKLHYLELGGDLDIQIFQNLPLPLRHRILQEGKVLFCKDEDELYRESYRVLRDFAHFSRSYQSYLQAVLDG